MKAKAGIALEAAEVDMTYGALMHFQDSLEKYKHWVRNKEGTPLPGMEVAITEINKELRDLILLQQRIYAQCF